MNDFERQLRRQPFRQPPADLRATLFGEEPAANLITPPAWTWRDWLWPSPQAWAALAALWLIFFSASQLVRPGISGPATTFTASPAENAAPVSLFAYHGTHDFSHVLDLPN